MIILAGTIILTLNQNGIIGKAQEAADLANLRQVESAVMLAWADAYAGGEREVDDLKAAVDTALANIEMDLSKYEITVTTNGVTVKVKETNTPPVVDPDEGDEPDDTTPTQLSKPTVSLSGDTLTITDNASNGSYTASFEVYVGEEKKATITASSSTTFDLLALELTAGTYTITVKAVAAEDSTITTSEASEAVEYVVEEVASVPESWQAYVSEVTAEDVPIPKGFVVSPYTDEDEVDEGLVIYALTETEITNGVTDITTIDGTQQTSLETRNQFVWVPVSRNNFTTEFIRDNFGKSYTLSNELGTNYWEIVLSATNMPESTQSTSYVSPATLQEATAMYESVKEYGGFYIGRYEAGGNEVDSTTKFGRGTLSVTMGKYPYNGIKWGTSMSNEVLTGGAVTLSRGMYQESNTKYGVVSTLTYGVQWDRALNWIKSIKGESFSLTSSSEYGNYNDTTLSKDDFNTNAKYATAKYNSSSSTTGNFDVGTWTNGTSFTTRSGNYIMTTGALSKANLCNIYDMAGNIYEMTMEGVSPTGRVIRGGSFSCFGSLSSSQPVTNRNGIVPSDVHAGYGFRPSLYIKK